MPPDLKFSLDVSRFISGVLDKAPAVAAKQMRSIFRDIGRAFKIKIQRKRLRGGTTPGSLARRTGSLARSLGFRVVGRTLNELIGFVGFGPPAAQWFDAGVEDYAFIHETGGTIQAVSTEHLAIPAGDNLTGAGVANVESPRLLTNPAFVPWLFNDGDDGYLVFEDEALMFLLKHEVEIPERLHFADDWDAFQDDILVMMRLGLKRMVKQLQKGGQRRDPTTGRFV